MIFDFSSSLKRDIVSIVKSRDNGYPTSYDDPAPNKKPILLKLLFKVGKILFRSNEIVKSLYWFLLFLNKFSGFLINNTRSI